MDARLLPDPAGAPNPIDSDAFQELWTPGHIERMAAMRADRRQPADQERKKRQDMAAIAGAFRFGWSR